MKYSLEWSKIDLLASLLECAIPTRMYQVNALFIFKYTLHSLNYILIWIIPTILTFNIWTSNWIISSKHANLHPLLLYSVWNTSFKMHYLFSNCKNVHIKRFNIGFKFNSTFWEWAKNVSFLTACNISINALLNFCQGTCKPNHFTPNIIHLFISQLIRKGILFL